MMLDGLGPYPTMQDSGVPWLGEVPEHWMVRRIKTLFREKGERSNDGTGLLLSLTRARGLLPQSEASNRLAGADDLSKYKVCRPSDLVMNRMQAWSGMFAVSPLEGLVSPDYSVFEAIEPCEVKHFEHLFKTPGAVDQFVQASKGIGSGFNRLYTPDFGAVPIVVPPLSEQAAIVRFLDYADRRIRRYIRAKQQLIAVLEEQKQAVIHRAVTRGLDPNVRLKSSGVEWFPEVPVHWNVLPMRRVIYSAVDGPHFSPTYLDTGIPFLSARNVKSDGWSLEDVKYISEDDYDEFNRRVKPVHGDVLYTKGGTTGVARVVDLVFPFQVWVHIAVLKVNKNVIDPEFLAAALNSTRCYEQSQLFTRGATNQDLGLGRMKGIELPVPPALPEQQAIVGYLRTGLGQVLEAISATNREIDLLREYRTRLIADVVTGKLDVREVAAGLPDVDSLAGDDTLDGGNATHDASDSESEVATTGRDERRGPDGCEARA